MAAARLFFEKGVSLFPYTGQMRARDSHMRDRIQELMESHENARFLHICGWQHLRDPRGLYAPLNPHKVFIHDKAFVFDLGNVILPFDNHRIAEKLHVRSALKDRYTPSDIFDYLFDWEKGSIKRLRRRLFLVP